MKTQADIISLSEEVAKLLGTTAKVKIAVKGLVFTVEELYLAQDVSRCTSLALKHDINHWCSSSKGWACCAANSDEIVLDEPELKYEYYTNHDSRESAYCFALCRALIAKLGGEK